MTSAEAKLNELQTDPGAEYGTLTVSLSSQWEAEALATLIMEFVHSYDPLSTAITVYTGQTIAEWDERWGRSRSRGAIPLTIHRIHLASPGLLSFIGDLNPLKLILEFITAWRAENTKRGEAINRVDIERNAHRIEATRLMLEAAKASGDQLETKTAQRFIEKMLMEPLWSAARIANSPGVVDVKLRKVRRAQTRRIGKG